MWKSSCLLPLDAQKQLRSSRNTSRHFEIATAIWNIGTLILHAIRVISVCCNSCNFFFAVNACNKKIVSSCKCFFCGKSCKPESRVSKKLHDFFSYTTYIFHG